MIYNKAGVNALDKVREVTVSFGLPLTKARKFNGIFNATEMQTENGEYPADAVNTLDQALLASARWCISETEYPKLENAIVEFERKLERARQRRLKG